MYKRAKEEREEIAKRVRELRERYGLSRTGMYERLGVPQRTIQSWEEMDTAPAMYIVDWMEKMLENTNTGSLNDEEKQELDQAIESQITMYNMMIPQTPRQQKEVERSVKTLKSVRKKIFGINE
jgi:ribosome-binding protein aMBF1 (putative translation factor)